MLLFLDYNPIRAVMAYNRMPEKDKSNTVWCTTAQEAIITLWDYREVLTKVSLEHDLQEEPYMNTKSEQSGMEVVRYLEKLQTVHPIEFISLKKVKFTIHTHNDHAGPIMTDRLRKLGLTTEWIPFGE